MSRSAKSISSTLPIVWYLQLLRYRSFLSYRPASPHLLPLQYLPYSQILLLVCILSKNTIALWRVPLVVLPLQYPASSTIFTTSMKCAALRYLTVSTTTVGSITPTSFLVSILALLYLQVLLLILGLKSIIAIDGRADLLRFSPIRAAPSAN